MSAASSASAQNGGTQHQMPDAGTLCSNGQCARPTQTALSKRGAPEDAACRAFLCVAFQSIFQCGQQQWCAAGSAHCARAASARAVGASGISFSCLVLGNLAVHGQTDPVTSDNGKGRLPRAASHVAYLLEQAASLLLCLFESRKHLCTSAAHHRFCAGANRKDWSIGGMLTAGRVNFGGLTCMINFHIVGGPRPSTGDSPTTLCVGLCAGEKYDIVNVSVEK